MKAKLVLPLLAVLSLPAWGQQVEMKAVKEKIPTYQIGSPEVDPIFLPGVFTREQRVTFIRIRCMMC